MIEVTSEQIGKPILAADVILATIKKDKRGIFVGFYCNPEDMTQQLMMANLGDVMRLFVTLPDLGA